VQTDHIGYEQISILIC